MPVYKGPFLATGKIMIIVAVTCLCSIPNVDANAASRDVSELCLGERFAVDQWNSSTTELA